MSNGQGQPSEHTEFELVRVARLDEGCFGVLKHLGVPFAVTLERTYSLPGDQQHVKIPAGVWLCRSRYYHRGGYDSYEVTGVPGHSLLMIHVLNVEEQSDGCIGVGRRFGPLWDSRLGVTVPAILESQFGFDDFMRRTGGRLELWLRVVDWPHALAPHLDPQVTA